MFILKRMIVMLWIWFLINWVNSNWNWSILLLITCKIVIGVPFYFFSLSSLIFLQKDPQEKCRCFRHSSQSSSLNHIICPFISLMSHTDHLSWEFMLDFSDNCHNHRIESFGTIKKGGLLVSWLLLKLALYSSLTACICISWEIKTEVIATYHSY